VPTCSRRTRFLDRLHSLAFPRSNGSRHCEISMCNKGLGNIGLLRGASHFLPCASSYLSHLSPRARLRGFFLVGVETIISSPGSPCSPDARELGK
jgi:hypothetical protein